jgi:hypothetical protein
VRRSCDANPDARWFFERSRTQRGPGIRFRLPTDLTIFSPHEKQIIGHGRYSVTQTDGIEVVQGENDKGRFGAKHAAALLRLRRRLWL